MQINNINSPNFNGYKNVLANKVIRSNGEKITYMSMQLDNIGANDLSTWQVLQKKFMNRNFFSDVVTFNLYEFMGDNILAFSHDLLDIDEVKKGSEEEKILLKAYSFLASLTNRIKSDSALVRDGYYRPMAYETKADLADVLFSSKQNSAELDRAVFGAYYPDYSPQGIAKDINNKIQDKMMDYFS